ncbi:MAG: glycosyltransferase family protein [Roseburia sp.]|nr:glycosyltransferase family protein [Roseburia sp.]
MKYLALIQARCDSTRFPNKVLKKFVGKSDIEWVVERVKRSRYVDEVIVITSIEKSNLPLIALCAGSGIRISVGSENDVLDRYYQTAKLLQPEYVIRITADCPLFDWRYLDMAIEQLEEDTDYMGQMEDSFPDGLDIEIMKFSVLKESWELAELTSEREHVTQYIRKHPEKYKIQNLVCPIPGIAEQRWTLDEEEDYQVIDEIYRYFQSIEKDDFVTEDILEFLKKHPEIEGINKKFARNEGLQKSIAEDKIAVIL